MQLRNDGAAPVSGSLEERLAMCADLTPAERAVAAFMTSNPRRLPFETAAGIGAAAGVSEMTVLRFVRSLGYANLKKLKSDLAARESEVGGALDDRWQRFRVPAGSDEAMAASLRREIAALVQVYEVATSPVFAGALAVLTAASHVRVLGFQASKGLALDFATRLKYARPGVRFVEGTSGTFSEIFAEDDGPSCVMMIDTAAYSTTGFRVAERCVTQGLPLVIVTDRFANWARRYTPHVLSVSTQIGTFWDTPSGIAALLNLLLNAVTAGQGRDAEARVVRLKALGAHFDAFGYEPVRPESKGDGKG